MKADTEYRFSFVNFSKPDSQYSVGMRPVLYSELEAARTGVGWVRAGTEMTYFKESKSPSDANKPSQYIMSFTLSFPHENDTWYVMSRFQCIIAGKVIFFDHNIPPPPHITTTSVKRVLADLASAR